MSFVFNIILKGKLAAFAAVLLATGALGKVEPAAVVPGAYIVEFVDAAANAPAFFQNLSGNAIDATPRLTLSYELFNGASFKLEGTHDNETTVDTINQMAVVSQIWPVRLYKTPANIIHVGTNSLEPASSPSKRTADIYSPHVMGGVDKLRAEGFTGEGIHVGIIDTGVDYNHPALGAGFGPGHKVVGGYDLVGNAYDGTNTPVPDSDPMDCNGHGTHVSGIIGANDNQFGFTGVVPNATLSMWKVFGCTGSSGDDVLIQAFNMAYQAGVDVISASIGGASGWVEGAWDVAVQRIAEKGTPCIIAAGNDGADGLFYTSSAGESFGAIGVGSIDNTNGPGLLVGAGYHLDNNATETTFAYAMGKLGDFGTISVPLYAPTLDSTVAGDGCNAFPATTPDLSNYVVLIRRGTCAFDTKIANAAAFGAKRVLFYNNVASTPISPGDTSTTVPVGMVSDVQGATWISQLKAGRSITIDFQAVASAPSIYTNQPNVATGGSMSTFSSWGPSFEGWIKPQVSAPGGLILSTYPLALGGYAVESGTSMATPFISGVVALIKQIKGKTISPKSLASLLASTATPVGWNDGVHRAAYLAPVVQQGGGLVNAYKAAHSTTLVDLDNIPLNDTSHFQSPHAFNIFNSGTASVTYNFQNILAATAYTLSGSITPDAFPPSLNSNATSGAAIRFSPASITLGPNQAGQVVAHFTLPQGLDRTRIPVYSGYVQINGTNGDALSIPYAGIASKLKDAKIVDTESGYPFLASTASPTAPITSNQTSFLLPGNGTATNTTAFPAMVYSLAMGSRIVRVDIVPENLNNVPRIIGEQTIGSIPSYPAQNYPRMQVGTAAWDGRLDGGSFAPEGRYRFMLRALKIFGSAKHDHDYELYYSAFFDIKYAVKPKKTH